MIFSFFSSTTGRIAAAVATISILIYTVNSVYHSNNAIKDEIKSETKNLSVSLNVTKLEEIISDKESTVSQELIVSKEKEIEDNLPKINEDENNKNEVPEEQSKLSSLQQIILSDESLNKQDYYDEFVLAGIISLYWRGCNFVHLIAKNDKQKALFARVIHSAIYSNTLEQTASLVEELMDVYSATLCERWAIDEVELKALKVVDYTTEQLPKSKAVASLSRKEMLRIELIDR